jgi:multiple antibiotic resistance protein
LESETAVTDPWITEYTRFVVALATIIDPLAAIPFFLQMTESYTAEEKRRTARTAAIVVGVVLAVAAITGDTLLRMMGTSLPAFRVGGGIVMLLMAISMLGAQETPLRQTREELAASGDKTAIAVVPLGIPLLAGPGAISAVVIQMDRGSGLVHGLLVVGSILLVAGSCHVVFRNAERVGRAIGPIGLNVIVRLFGLILAAIAIETIAYGLKVLFPPLAG